MEYAPPAQVETLRSRSGAVQGTVVRIGATIVLKRWDGHLLGTFDGTHTRDRRGHILGYGNLLTTLLEGR